MRDQLDASTVPKAARLTEPGTFRNHYLPDQLAVASAQRMSRRASVLLAITLSLGLWAAIGAAIISLISVMHG